MLKIRLSEVSDLQELMCFAMLPALNCPVCDSEPVLTILVADHFAVHCNLQFKNLPLRGRK